MLILFYHDDFAPKYLDVTVVKDVVNKTLSFWQALRKTLGIQRVNDDSNEHLQHWVL